MKMRFRFLALAVCLVLALTACKTNLPVPSAPQTTASTEAPSTAAPTEAPSTAAPTEPQTTASAQTMPAEVEVEGVPSFMHLTYDFHDYFTLGEYKGVSYEPTDSTVTAEELQAEIDTYLQNAATTNPSDKTVVENGDIQKFFRLSGYKWKGYFGATGN